MKHAEVKKSAPDIQIVSEKGVLCDADGCEGWKVAAKRDSDELFDIEVRLDCSHEDWIVIEQEEQE